jgi:hypothetical protein
MSNLEVVRSYEIVSVIVYLIGLWWIIRQRNPLYLGALIGATFLYGFDWAFCTRGFFNTTYNPDLIRIPGLTNQGMFEPAVIPFNYGLPFSILPVLLTRSTPVLEQKFGKVGTLFFAWMCGMVGVAVYEIPTVHVLHIWTYHQQPEYMVYGFPWSNFWLAGNLVLFPYIGFRYLSKWAAIPPGAGFAIGSENTWKGILMGALPIWGGLYITYLIQLFWYANVHPWVDVGRPF